MDSMHFAVKDLTFTLKKNREKHVAEFKEVQAGYRRKVIETLERALIAAKKGRAINAYPLNHLIVPRVHTEAYNRVIEMLSMTSDEAVVLTQDEFSKYVQDDWEWTSLHKQSVTAYNLSNFKRLP
jgi:hypothetical protein